MLNQIVTNESQDGNPTDSLGGLLDLLTALTDETARLPAPLGLFARELEAGLSEGLGVGSDDC